MARKSYVYDYKRLYNDTIGGEKYNVVYYSNDGKVRIGVTPQKERGKKVKVGNKQVYFVVAQEKPLRRAWRYTYYYMAKGQREMTTEVQKLLRKYSGRTR